MSAAARIAGAPISWGACEVPGWGYQMKAHRVLDQMQTLGLAATEAGPDGFLPEDPAALRDELAARGLQLVGGFTPLVLHHLDGWHAELERVAGRFAACGGEVVVLAAATGQDDYDTRPELAKEEWSRLCSALDDAAVLAADAGLRAVLHPHVGTLVERPGEIARVLDATSVELCLDTGHIMAGGGDPVDLARQAPARIGHVHFKDVRASIAGRVAAGELSYSAAVRGAMYCPLGDGDVNVPAIVSALKGADYKGWYVLEQDVMLTREPADGEGPWLSVDRSARYLRDVLRQDRSDD